MTVWLVVASYNHSDTVLGVFSTNELAMAYFKDHKDDGDMEGYIVDYEVDCPREDYKE